SPTAGGICSCAPYYPLQIHYCPGSSVMLNAPPSYVSYQWFAPAGFPMAPSQTTLAAPTITNPANSNVYTVQLSYYPGCVFQTSVTLVQQSLSIVGLGADPTCPGGSSGSASVAVTAGIDSLQYLWQSSSGSVVSTASVAAGLSSGVYSVSVSVGGVNG